MSRVVDHVVVISREDHEHITGLSKFKKVKAAYVPGVGVDTDLYEFSQVARDQVRAAFGTDDDTIVVGYVGRITQDKGVDRLLDAYADFRTHRPTELWLVGEASGLERNSLPVEKLMAGPSDIRWLGTRSDVPALLSAVDIFVLPSVREGLPVALMEAMAAERAVVALDVRGCRELVDDGAGVLLRSNADPREISEAMTLLAREPSLRRVLGFEARRVIEGNHSARVVAERYRQLIPDIVRMSLDRVERHDS